MPVFREGLAMVLCIPSPACRDMVGERVGNGKVDLFGDSVLCQNLPGDGWRIRHDRIKQEMVVGRFNEVSNDLNNLVEKMAESRVNLVARRDGRQLSDNEKVVVGQLRRSSVLLP